jgi:hypothetical protein
MQSIFQYISDYFRSLDKWLCTIYRYFRSCIDIHQLSGLALKREFNYYLQTAKVFRFLPVIRNRIYFPTCSLLFLVLI